MRKENEWVYKTLWKQKGNTPVLDIISSVCWHYNSMNVENVQLTQQSQRVHELRMHSLRALFDEIYILIDEMGGSGDIDALQEHIKRVKSGE